MGKRRIPLRVLGPSALRQLAALGVDVSKAGAGSSTGGTPSGGGKYHISAQEARTCDGIVFASKLEMACYRFLKERGIVFERQTEHLLQDGFEHAGKMVAPIRYVSDFRIPVPGGVPLVVDAKGVVTPVFRLKQKLLLRQGVVISCVRSVAELAALLQANGLFGKVHE
jgi:hypothetical protein